MGDVDKAILLSGPPGGARPCMRRHWQEHAASSWSSPRQRTVSLPQDKAALAAKILNQVWEAA